MGASSAGPEKTDTFSAAPSVAVLPFDDMSEQGDQGYFCEGIAEEILNSLCQVAGLRVASRAASFRFRGKHMDIAKIAETLKVKAILEGSVRQFDDHLRITAQLINAADGYHLWTRQYDRQREDLFAIQEDIAEQISKALSLTMRRNRLREQREADPLAYDYFLRGRNYFARCNSRDSVYARQMFKRAVETDPGYGRAWAWLAYAYGFEYMYFDATTENHREALHTSARALTLAPNLAESHIATGIAFCMRSECAKANEAFEKAIKLDPKRYEAWYFYARTRIREGKPREAMKLLQKAARGPAGRFQIRCHC